jgi:predicted NAD/FAD-dependent oxidoreductase
LIAGPVVVVGAGVSGLACARRLAGAGLRAEVLERGRTPGGRTADRHIGTAVADTGAQYVTATEPGFERVLRELAATGRAVAWATSLHTFEGGRITGGGRADSGRVRWAFPDGMRTLARHLATGLTVLPGTTVTRVERAGDGWLVHTDRAGVRPARAVVLAMPAPAAVTLAEGAGPLEGLAATAARAAYDPCLTLVAGYPHAAPPPWRGVFTPGHEVLAFVTNDSSKRAHGSGELVIVAHADGGWSRACDDDRAEGRLVAAVEEVTGLARPAWTQLVRWPFAQVTATVGEPFLLTEGAGPGGMCGDWCDGARVEGAWRSGDRLGAELAARLTGQPPPT